MTTEAQGEKHRGMNGGTHAEDGRESSGTDRLAMARDVAGRAGEVAGEVAGGVAGRAGEVAGEVANRLPAAAATTREAISTAQLRMESSSDEMLTNGAMLSLGIAIGLLLGGANRLLVALALIPAAAMGATLLDRRSRSA